MRRKNQESGMEQLCFWKDGFMDKQEVADACLLTGPGRMAEGANAVPAPENAEPPQAKPVSEPVAEVLESEHSTTPKTCAVAQAAPPPEPAQEPAPRGEPERFSLVKCAENIPALKPAVAKAEKAEKRDRRSETSAENGKNGGRKPHTPEVWAGEYLARRYKKGDLYTLRYLDGIWYKYYDNGWAEWSENDVRSDVTAFLQEIDITHIGKSLVNDMLENLKSNLLCALDSKKYKMPCFLPNGESAADWFPLRNKVINVKAIAEAFKRGEAPPDSAFMEHSPRLFMAGSLDYEYDPEATCPKWEKYLAEVQPDAENRRMLQMLAGLLLTWDSRTVAFFLLGDGGTGKSVFLHVLQAMLGNEKNCSSIPLAAFGRRFVLAPLTKKRANIVEEMPVEEGNPSISALEANFKLVAGGGRIDTERKFQNYNGEGSPATARLVFATNQFPPFADRSEAVWDRVRIIPFNQRIRGTEAENSYLDKEIASSELPGILNWALRGLAELPRNRFPESPEGLRIKEEERGLSDHEKEFLTEYAEEVPNPGPTDFIPSKELYHAYCDWIRDNNYKAKARGNFGKAVRRVFKNAKEERIRAGNDRPYVWRNISRKREI